MSSQPELDSDVPRRVVVTGGSRGIGRGVVAALARAGYETHFTFCSSADHARQLETELGELGCRVRGHRCDGADETAVRAFVSAFVAERGAPYAVVNNMGITRDASLLRMSSDDWHGVVQTNLNSAFYMTHALLGHMIGNGDGAFIQMSSVTGIRGNPGQTNYGATKAALLGFTRSLAREVGRFNIRANAVLPGFIDTDMVSSLEAPQRAALQKTIPLRRFGCVEDVAHLVCFLLSREASYITGQSFVVDGGLTS